MNDTPQRKYGIREEEFQRLSELIVCGYSEQSLKQRYMNRRFRLRAANSRLDYPEAEHQLANEKAEEEMLESLTELGFHLQPDETHPLSRHDESEVVDVLTATHEAYKLNVLLFRARGSHPFCTVFLHSPAGDCWEYKEGCGFKSPVQFVKRCLRRMPQWEKDWQACVSELRKIRKVDEIGRNSLQLILNRVEETLPGVCQSCTMKQATRLTVRLDKYYGIEVMMPNQQNMAELTRLPEQLKDLYESLRELGNLRARYRELSS